MGFLLPYQSRISNLTGDTGGKLADGSADDALAAAVIRYSTDRPQLACELLAASGGAVGLPVGWQSQFSRVVKLEYPIGKRPPAYLRPEDWFMALSPDGEAITLMVPPPDGASMQCLYTIAQVLTSTVNTIPTQDQIAVCCWAASLLCDELASAYSANTEPTIQADRVDYTSPQRNYQARAEKLRGRYYDALGIDPKKVDPAGVDVNFRDKSSLGGNRITHPLTGWFPRI